ncbi:ATP-binding protein [Streptomyces sp. BH-SS-21]|uniref:ATP-binding protein n=1 Tax=Streptomyces liliiviolaceus TaxID=2823109 RepID=A0A941B7W6_9ACTN|nr:ATP-binding protein [Streptomyces liliiviolaceus]MBQ0850272.1 ATP-binding protein [Streptomyces liliiviolaceus]
MKNKCGDVINASARCLSSARQGIREKLAGWGRNDIADDAVLIASELLTNAFRHGSPPVRLVLTLQSAAGNQRLRIEVTDDGAAFNTEVVRATWRHPSFGLGIGGRGLCLVEELSCDWGDRPVSSGHTVWAELPCGTTR